ERPPGRGLELHDRVGGTHRQRLAGAQVDGDAVPALVVDEEPNGREGFRARVGTLARLAVGIAPRCAKKRRLALGGTTKPPTVCAPAGAVLAAHRVPETSAAPHRRTACISRTRSLRNSLTERVAGRSMQNNARRWTRSPRKPAWSG